MKPDILVLTKTYSTSLGVIRSLGAAGYHIEVFYVTGLKGVTKIVSSSKYVDHLTEFNGRKDEEIVERLTKLYEGKTEKVFLFPADDYAASLADRYSDRLSEYYILPYAGKHEQGEITRLMDKSVQSELAGKCGFPIPREWNISLREEIHIPEDMVYPCFVKLSVSAAGYKKEIGVTESREELQEKLKALQQANPERNILIQEFLDITGEYSMSGLCLDQEILLPAIVKKKAIGIKERGVTLLGELVPVSEIRPVEKPLYKMLKALSFVGMFDMEVLCTKDAIYFGEINLRAGGPNYSYFASGINLPDILVRAMTEGGAEVPKIRMHKVFLNEKAALEDFFDHNLSYRQIRKMYDEADILLMQQKSDPRPGKEFLRYLVKSNAKKRIKAPARKIKAGLFRTKPLIKKLDAENESGIFICAKPDFVTYEMIRQVVHEAQAAHPEVKLDTEKATAGEIQEKVGDDGEMFVALDGEKLVGTMAICPEKCGKWYIKGRPAAVRFIAVLPEYGRRHIASDLMKACVCWAEERGFDTLMWTTAHNNEPAIKTGKHNDFYVVDYLKFAKSESASIRMVRWLTQDPPGKYKRLTRYYLNRMKVLIKHRM